MKLFYLSFLLLFALVFAQDEVTIEPPQSRCYSGSIENGTGEILERECDFRMQVCMTKIESYEENGLFKVIRECTQGLACRNNAGGNIPKCFPGQNGIRICFFCCDTDLCNELPTRIPGDEDESSGDFP